MKKRYMVIGWGFNKKTGNPYSRCARVVEDLKNGTYCFIDDKDNYYLDYHKELGTIINVESSVTDE